MSATIEDEVQVVRFGLWWPDGRPDQLRARADAWRRMARALHRCVDDLLDADRMVEAGCRGAAIDAYLAHQRQVLTALNDQAEAGTQLARSLEELADAIDEVRNELVDMAGEIMASLAIGFGLAMLTAGISGVVAADVTATMIARAGVLAASLAGRAIAIASGVAVFGAFGAAEAGATNLIVQTGTNAATNPNHDPFDGIELPELWVSMGGGFVLGGAFGGLTTPRLPAVPAVGLARAEAEEAAAIIGRGEHAWAKHAVERDEFLWITSREEFVDYITDVLEHPSAVKRIDEFRTAYWDEATETVVIRNTAKPGRGTAYQPSDGRMYFEKVLR